MHGIDTYHFSIIFGPYEFGLMHVNVADVSFITVGARVGEEDGHYH